MATKRSRKQSRRHPSAPVSPAGAAPRGRKSVSGPATRRAKSHPPAPPADVVPIVGVGASAGGYDAFRRFLGSVPRDSGMAYVLIQHLDPRYVSTLAGALSKNTGMAVVQITDQMKVAANQVYVIPPNATLIIESDLLKISKPVEPRGTRTPIDVFFRSLAESRREKAIGIILTGTGTDGVAGLQAIKMHGGMVMAQDPQTAEHDGMPRSAIATGLVDFVLPIEEMPAALIRYIRNPYLNGDALKASDLNNVVAVVRARSDFDFRHYKKGTLMRRIQRRMGLRQISSIPDYLDLLRQDSEEVTRLHKDLLIGVTGFFREGEAFQALEGVVIPEIMKDKGPDSGLRVWVPSCATGEEAYSVAMLFLAAIERTGLEIPFQLFATDVDREALAFARYGIYPESVAADVPPDKLKKFLTRAGDHHFQVNKALRESVVFAPQNLIADPPFSKLDLVSCRNLLIYLQPEAQMSLLALFHFALRPGGFLFLGSSENLGTSEDMFEPISKKWRTYRKIGPDRYTRLNFPIPPPMHLSLLPRGESIPRKEIKFSVADLTQRLLLEDYAPASVLITRRYAVLYLFGPVGRFLDVPSGEPTRDLLNMAREGLRQRLRGAVHKALRDGAPVAVEGVSFKRNGDELTAHIRVRPIIEPRSTESLVLVTFEETRERPGLLDATAASRLEDDALVSQLEEELKSTKEELQSTIEELETSNEELKASNEEVMSTNEELQSTNEELETSREELQSLNEELSTVNTQLRNKVEELEAANNDLDNLLASADQATIFLDGSLRIKWFSPATQRLVSVIPADVGRPIADFATRFSDELLISDAETVVERLTPVEREVRDDGGKWFIRRVVPYRTADNKIDGVVITFSEVSRLKKAQEELSRRVREQASLAELRSIALVGREMMEEAVSMTCQTLGGDLAAVFEAHSDGESFLLRSGNGWKRGMVGRSMESGPRSHAAMVVASRDPVCIENLLKERRFKPSKLFLDHGVVSGLCVAVPGNGRAFGALGVFTKQPRVFTEDEKHYIQASANVLGLAVQRQRATEALISLNKTLEQKISERTSVARLLQEIARAASEAESVNDAIRGTIEGTCRHMGWTVGHAYSLTPHDEYVDTGIWAPQPAESLAKLVEASSRLTFRQGDGLVGRVAATGKVEMLADAGDRRAFRRARAARQSGIKSAIAVPIRAGRRVSMVVEFFSSRGLDQEDVLQPILEPIGALLGRVMERHDLERQIATVADHERRTMGRDLHDSVGQQLTGIGLIARSFQKKLMTGSPLEKDSFAHLVRQIDQAKMQIRALANGLLPVGLSAEALVDALREFLETCRKTYEIDCTFLCPRPVPVEDNFMANHLYRIVEEAVHNAVKHSKAGHIKVSLEADRNALRVSIQDDGVGMQSKRNRQDGTGLRIMRYRASLIDATLEIESARGKGTTLVCTLRGHGFGPTARPMTQRFGKAAPRPRP